MKEAIIRFEERSPDQDGAISGTIDRSHESGPPVRFDGWLQLLALLEEMMLTPPSGTDVTAARQL